MRSPESSAHPATNADPATPGAKTAATVPAATPWPRAGIVVALGLGAACAATPAGALGTALLFAAPPGPVGIALFTAVSVLVAGAGIRAMAALLRRRARTAYPARVALATVCVQALAAVALDRAAPFRCGLLSLALYSVPALIAAAAALARSHAALAAWAAAAVGLALSVPCLGAAQRHWYAEQWLTAHHIPSSALVQVVDVPGLSQEPYIYDQASGQVTAFFDWYPDWMLPAIAEDAETVTPGAADPCGPLTFAEGDGTATKTPGCTQIDAGLWQRSDAQGNAGYVAYRDGVTLALTGSEHDHSELLTAISRAHSATDADLWQRSAPPDSLIGWLLW